MSTLITLESAIALRRRPDEDWQAFDIDIRLGSRTVSRLDGGKPTIRTMTVGFRMWTEYKVLADMPLATFAHECGHSYQTYMQHWPRSVLFVVNYLVLKSGVYEQQARSWVQSIMDGTHQYIRIADHIRPRFKQ